MAKRSAGILLYRGDAGGIEVCSRIPAGRSGRTRTKAPGRSLKASTTRGRSPWLAPSASSRRSLALYRPARFSTLASWRNRAARWCGHGRPTARSIQWPSNQAHSNWSGRRKVDGSRPSQRSTARLGSSQARRDGKSSRVRCHLSIVFCWLSGAGRDDATAVSPPQASFLAPSAAIRLLSRGPGRCAFTRPREARALHHHAIESWRFDRAANSTRAFED